MAVPFNLPVEEDGIDEIIRYLQILLIRLSEQRSRTQSSSSSSSRLNRVRHQHHHHHHRIDDDANISHSDLPDVIVCSRIPTTARPASSSKSCYEDTKPQQQDNDDCIEVGVVLCHTTTTTTTTSKDETIENKKKNNGSPERGKDIPGDGLWSKVPECLRGSLWTAVPVICVVGWHLFQTTY